MSNYEELSVVRGTNIADLRELYRREAQKRENFALPEADFEEILIWYN